MKIAESVETLRIDRRRFHRRLIGATGAAALGWLPARLRAQAPPQPPAPVRVRIWCEGTAPREVYPEDVDGAIAGDLRKRPGLAIETARLDQPDAGLPDAVLDATDVLVWWGRLRHDEVPDARAAAIVERVRAGKLGLVALHGSFASKPFKALMGMPCSPGAWREDGSAEHVTVKDPDHPIARGVAPFTIPRTAVYAEPFAVPEPESVVLVSTWDSGETFRSGLTWTIGQGRVVYFRPGHDGFPILFHPAVRQVIFNATTWAAKRV
jgi:trehalose utilization protein